MTLATRGDTAIRIIVFMGMGTFLFLMLISFGMRKALVPQESTRVQPGRAHTPFNESRAWADVEHLAALGPRPSGSPAMDAQQKYILEQLRAARLKTRQFRFEAETPRGKLPMTNLAGIVEGTRPGVILLSGHYDTKYLPDINFIGANDGAANVAWLLEMARVLGPSREGRSIWLMFFDGEEAQAEWSESDSLYGSRHAVATFREESTLADIAAVINIDMIGDCYLCISRDPGAPGWLAGIVWDSAERDGYRAHFGKGITDLEDDHLPFREAGIPALELIDFSYGGSQLDHRRNWHTVEDTLDKVCPGSLRAVGDVIYDALAAVDGRLDTIGLHSDGH